MMVGIVELVEVIVRGTPCATHCASRSMWKVGLATAGDGQRSSCWSCGCSCSSEMPGGTLESRSTARAVYAWGSATSTRSR